jgi:hypothetical protein
MMRGTTCVAGPAAATETFTDYSARCFPEGRPILACAEDLSTKLHADIQYVPDVTTISTSPTEVVETRRA